MSTVFAKYKMGNPATVTRGQLGAEADGISVASPPRRCTIPPRVMAALGRERRRVAGMVTAIDRPFMAASCRGFVRYALARSRCTGQPAPGTGDLLLQ